ncbi:MAG: protein kinase domain-containing protein [Terriglobales bacterium]
MIGTKFGNYKIEQKLGEGGMGVVYLAVDTDLDRRVALKTLSAGGSQDDELVQRFLREAKAASRLQHPSIVTLYHFGLEGSTRYMVMEYIEGSTLRKAISGRPMNIAQLTEYAIQVIDGLVLAHENGVIHRDLKSENIMVTSRGQVKILDFGLAKLKTTKAPTGDEETAFRTQFGMVVGTVTTMSPEQAMGKEVDASSDIFSFGVILYQMATGKLPFEGPTPQATLALILNQEPTPPSHLNPDVPTELERLIQHCLQKGHVFRPSAREVLAKLKNIQASLSGTSMPAADYRSVSTTGAAAATGDEPTARMAVRPASSTRMRAPSSTRMQATAGDVASRKAIFQVVKWLRVVLSIATLTVPLSYFAYFIISGGLIRAQAVEGTLVMRFIQAVVIPPLAMADRVLAFRTVVEGWNFLLLGLGIAAFLVRYVVLLPLTIAEQWAKTRMLKAQATAPQVATLAMSETAAAPRMALLREYAEAKKVLFESKKRMAFYALDVVGSTKMKAGEDQLVVEHAFAEFKKYVERILQTHNCWKSAWTPDGAMCAFRDTTAAVKAAQEVLRGLGWFNEGVHALTQKFNIRSGVHAGEVVFPDDKDIVEISDFVIDVAGHLQKHCGENALWISRDVFDQLESRDGFAPAPQDVDGHKIFAWRPEEKAQAAANQAAANQ